MSAAKAPPAPVSAPKAPPAPVASAAEVAAVLASLPVAEAAAAREHAEDAARGAAYQAEEHRLAFRLAERTEGVARALCVADGHDPEAFWNDKEYWKWYDVTAAGMIVAFDFLTNYDQQGN